MISNHLPLPFTPPPPSPEAMTFTFSEHLITLFSALLSHESGARFRGHGTGKIKGDVSRHTVPSPGHRGGLDGTRTVQYFSRWSNGWALLVVDGESQGRRGRVLRLPCRRPQAPPIPERGLASKPPSDWRGSRIILALFPFRWIADAGGWWKSDSIPAHLTNTVSTLRTEYSVYSRVAMYYAKGGRRKLSRILGPCVNHARLLGH